MPTLTHRIASSAVSVDPVTEAHRLIDRIRFAPDAPDIRPSIERLTQLTMNNTAVRDTVVDRISELRGTFIPASPESACHEIPALGVLLSKLGEPGLKIILERLRRMGGAGSKVDPNEGTLAKIVLEFEPQLRNRYLSALCTVDNSAARSAAARILRYAKPGDAELSAIALRGFDEASYMPASDATTGSTCFLKLHLAEAMARTGPNAKFAAYLAGALEETNDAIANGWGDKNSALLYRSFVLVAAMNVGSDILPDALEQLVRVASTGTTLHRTLAIFAYGSTGAGDPAEFDRWRRSTEPGIREAAAWGRAHTEFGAYDSELFLKALGRGGELTDALRSVLEHSDRGDLPQPLQRFLECSEYRTIILPTPNQVIAAQRAEYESRERALALVEYFDRSARGTIYPGEPVKEILALIEQLPHRVEAVATIKALLADIASDSVRVNDADKRSIFEFCSRLGKAAGDLAGELVTCVKGVRDEGAFSSLAEALGRSGDQGCERVLRLLTHPIPRNRELACKALQFIDRSYAEAGVRVLLRDPNFHVRYEAVLMADKLKLVESLGELYWNAGDFGLRQRIGAFRAVREEYGLRAAIGTIFQSSAKVRGYVKLMAKASGVLSEGASNSS